jgi:hypothetical protein
MRALGFMTGRDAVVFGFKNIDGPLCATVTALLENEQLYRFETHRAAGPPPPAHHPPPFVGP